MFANTLTLTVNAVPITLTRVNQDNFGSTYKSSDALGNWKLQFRNSVEKSTVIGVPDIERHNMFLEREVYQVGAGYNKYYSFTATIRMRLTSDPTVFAQIVAGAITLLGAQAGGMITGES